MLLTKRVVLAISRKYIVGAKIRLRDKKILKSFESEWKVDDFEEVLSEAKKTLKATRARILMADDLSYVLSLKIPSSLTGQKEREMIYEKVREEIPENLDGSEWDFREVRKISKEGKEGEKEVFVFAPVKSLIERLRDALKKVDLEVEAIEPQIFASQRHPNPLIGLALKKDLKGKDEEVLNLEVFGQADKPKEDGQTKPNLLKAIWSKRYFRPIFWAIFVTLFLIAGTLYLRERGSRQPDVGEPREVALTPESEIEIYKYSINLLNGTGQEEDIIRVRGLLEDNGFFDIKTGLAESFEYEASVVKTKETVPGSTLGEIRNSLRDYEVTFPSSYLENDYIFDIEIIVGKRKPD